MSVARIARHSPATKFATALERIGRGRCALCGHPAQKVASWFPTEACRRRLGAAKDRIVMVPLCRKHSSPANFDASLAAAQELIMRSCEAELKKPEAN